jgi:integrase
MAQVLGSRTVRDAYRVFAGFMREAVRQGLIRQSPCYSIVLPRVARLEPRFLAPDQVERLTTAIDDRYESLIYTGTYLGLRWSELAGLKKANLDMVGRRVAIVGALERIGNGWRYSEQMKTLRSRRRVSIPKFIVDLLKDRLRTAPERISSSPRLLAISSTTATSEGASGTRRLLKLTSSGGHPEGCQNSSSITPQPQTR